MPNAPHFWTDPLLLWFGSEIDAPSCPPEHAVGFEGHADFIAADATCGACSCEAPTGSCELSATITVNAATCAMNSTNTPHTPFDPVSGWTGACVDSTSIAAGKLCSGAACVQSITIAPLTLTESGCAPVAQPVLKNYPANWATFARTCSWTPQGACPSSDHVCGPTAPQGFRLCVGQMGDTECPTFSPYADRHVFYGGLDDTRGCSPCACGAPAGGVCSALVSVFSDAVCSTVVVAATVTSTTTQCLDAALGSALGSKSAGPMTYMPGACEASGGEPVGAAKPAKPFTFCCLP